MSGAKNMTWNEMIKTPIFYVMLILLTSGAFSGMMIISQASGMAKGMIGMSVAQAAVAVSVLSLFNTFGRIIAGYISDKIGRINTLMLACVLACGGLMCLYISKEGTVLPFYIGISIAGMSFGSFMGVFPGFTADQFGPKNNSVNYGIMFIGFALAGYFGPQIIRMVYTQTGAYQNAFLIAATLSAFGVVISLIFKGLKR